MSLIRMWREISVYVISRFFLQTLSGIQLYSIPFLGTGVLDGCKNDWQLDVLTYNVQFTSHARTCCYHRDSNTSHLIRHIGDLLLGLKFITSVNESYLSLNAVFLDSYALICDLETGKKRQRRRRKHMILTILTSSETATGPECTHISTKVEPFAPLSVASQQL